MIVGLSAVVLPKSDVKIGSVLKPDPLHTLLYEKYKIQVPVFGWPHHNVRYLRTASFLYNSIKEYEYNFNMLYTAYSLPNVILPFFGGVFVDKYGPELCCFIFICFTFIGQIIVAYGVTIKSFPLMIFGRIIFGIGGESICVASSSLLQKWFEFGEVALAMGMCLSISRIGSVTNNIVSPWLANNFHSLNETILVQYLDCLVYIDYEILLHSHRLANYLPYLLDTN